MSSMCLVLSKVNGYVLGKGTASSCSMGSSHKGKIPLKDDFFSSVTFLYIQANANPKVVQF